MVSIRPAEVLCGSPPDSGKQTKRTGHRNHFERFHFPYTGETVRGSILSPPPGLPLTESLPARISIKFTITSLIERANSCVKVLLNGRRICGQSTLHSSCQPDLFTATGNLRYQGDRRSSAQRFRRLTLTSPGWRHVVMNRVVT